MHLHSKNLLTMKKVLQHLKLLLIISVSFITFTIYFLTNHRTFGTTSLNLTEENISYDKNNLEYLEQSIFNMSRMVQQHLQDSKQNHIQKLLSLLSVPSIQNFLPHLIGNPLSLEPSFKISKTRASHSSSS